MKNMIVRMIVMMTVVLGSAMPGLSLATNNGGTTIVPFSSRAGAFYVEMPGTPTYKSETLNLGNGQSTVQHYHMVSNGNHVYIAAYADMPTLELARRDFNNVAGDQATGLRGRVVSERNTTLDGFPAKLIKIESADNILYSKVYLAGQRIYQVAFGMRKDATTPAEARRFFESFRITTGYRQ